MPIVLQDASNSRKDFKMKGRLLIWRKDREKQLGTMSIPGAKIDRLVRPPERDDRLLDFTDFTVRYGCPIGQRGGLHPFTFQELFKNLVAVPLQFGTDSYDMIDNGRQNLIPIGPG